VIKLEGSMVRVGKKTRKKKMSMVNNLNRLIVVQC